jgi:4-amino-4-deoxy-L-arabinose transferase-like glycosyltransferase
MFRAAGPSGRVAISISALVALAVRLFVAWCIPLAGGSRDPNCAPDELAHFWVARGIALGSAPRWPDDPVSIYAAFLPSHYLLHAGAMLPWRLGFDPDWLYRLPPVIDAVRGFPLARLGSVLLGTGTIVAACCSVWRLTGSGAATLLAGWVVALLPQLAFLGGYVNADSVTILACAALTSTLAAWHRRGAGRAGVLGIGVAMGFVVLGKVNGYAMLPPTMLWILWSGGRPMEALARLARASTVALSIAAPILAWNAVRNAGDVLGLARYRRFIAVQWSAHSPPEHALTSFARDLGCSSFGTLRNMDLFLPRWMYAWALASFVLGLGVATWAMARRRALASPPVLWLVATVAINVALVGYNCWAIDFQPQGRYALGSTINLALVAAVAPFLALGRRGRLSWAAHVALLMGAACWVSLRLLYRSPCAPGS